LVLDFCGSAAPIIHPIRDLSGAHRSGNPDGTIGAKLIVLSGIITVASIGRAHYRLCFIRFNTHSD
jgi:hypothetical protein